VKKFCLNCLFTKRNVPIVLFLFTAVMTTALAAGGALYSLWTFRKTDRELRQNLLIQTRFIAMGLNPERITWLTGTEADLKKPQYRQFKEQFISLRRANHDIRDIYLLGRKPDGTIFFYINAEPFDSSRSLMPGTPCKDITPAMRHSLETMSELVEEPKKDEQVALVPVRDTLTGKPLAMLGTVVASSTWNSRLFQTVLPVVAVTLLLIFIVLLHGILMQRRYRRGTSAPYWMDYLTPMLIAVLGTAFSCFAAWRIYENKVAARDMVFAELANRNIDLIAKGLNYIRTSELGSLTGFFEYCQAVDPNEFRGFTRHLLKNALVHTWGWIPIVTDNEKDKFEAKVRREYFPDFQIWQYGKNKQIVPASRRSAYYPLLYYASETDNPTLRGFDLGSEPALFQAIQTAIRTNLPIASEAVTVSRSEKPGTKKSIVIFSPVFNAASPETPKGFAGAAINLETLMGRSYRKYEMQQITFSSIYPNSPAKIMAAFGIDNNGNAPDSIVRPLFFFGKVFLVTVQPTRAFLRTYPVTGWRFPLLAGLCLTGALTVISILILRQRSELESLVSERTSDLSKSEQKYRLLFENMMSGFALHEMLYDKDGKAYDYRFLEVNPAFERLTGLKAEKLIGRTVMEILPETESYWIELYDKVVETGSGYVWRKQSRALNRIYDVCAFKTEGACFATIFTDVTDKVRMEEELTHYFNTSIDLFSITDLQGRFLRINPQWKEELGYEINDLLGSKAIKFIHPDDRKSTLEVLEKLNMKDNFVGFVNRFRHKDGSYRWLEWRSTSNGELTYASARDITERKKKELELLEINHSLKKSEETATQMARRAEAANIAKSEFLANMSHEIRTPMNAVIGMTGLMLDMNLTSEQRRYVDIIHHNGTALLGLLNDILDYSKMEAGKLEFERVDFDLFQLMDAIIETMNISASQKKLELICRIDPDVPPCLHGDPGRLRQILVNLIGNAVKFTNEGEVLVRVSVEPPSMQTVVEPSPESKKKVMLRFIVKDSGIGIPEDKIDGLFHVFTQVDATITRKFGGTGLGLSISRQLAGMMGGNVGVKSKLGKGSEFWATVQLEMSSSRHTDYSGIPANLLSGVRVLLASGSLTGCEAMADQLAFFGMDVEYVQSWSQTVKKLYQAMKAKAPFLFVVADIDLKDMNPVDAVRKLKEHPGMEELFIILLSSSKGIPNIAQPEKIGFSICLNKPLHHMELPWTISEFLMEKAAGHTEGERPHIKDISPCGDAAAIDDIIAALAKKGGKILLVEDIVTNQIVATAVLKKFGLQVDAVSNGREAIFSLEKSDYDLVLMDLQMPEMDGFETTRQIRHPRTPVRNPQIPIIAMTAHVMQSDQNRCLEAGMNDFISKPILIPVLAKVLAKWLLREEPKA